MKSIILAVILSAVSFTVSAELINPKDDKLGVVESDRFDVVKMDDGPLNNAYVLTDRLTGCQFIIMKLSYASESQPVGCYDEKKDPNLKIKGSSK
ncbi:homing endonuclease [Yersinia phage YerA41]|uniref:Homing endonuclease n=1 Tax=Yersinia phage vB_Yru_GN1 TaxID=3074381 RepID=A0AA86IYV9_9CAUD|nr:homing endonuclease [Yersinia phage YerA41]BES79836.1 homing endonuclease [Yersinia phage vB_Yru_GN1]